MKRVAALGLCLLAAWMLYSIGMELFIAWYSGAEPECDAYTWAVIAAQAIVNVAVIAFAWKVVRAPRSSGAEPA